MGEVWKALNTRLDRLVAIKFCHEPFSSRFEREARTIASDPVGALARLQWEEHTLSRATKSRPKCLPTFLRGSVQAA